VTGRKVGAKQRRAEGSLSHSSPDLTASSTTAASSSRYASPLSAMHTDLGRMVVNGGREANGFACAQRCRVRKSLVPPLARCCEVVASIRVSQYIRLVKVSD
jgi:hypothetical protein